MGNRRGGVWNVGKALTVFLRLADHSFRETQRPFVTHQGQRLVGWFLFTRVLA